MAPTTDNFYGKFVWRAHLFHDARFPFGECRVATKLIVYVFHLNLNASFGFLAVREAFGSGFLRRCRRRSWRCRRPGRHDVRSRIRIAVEAVERRMLKRWIFQLLRIEFLLPLAVTLLAVIVRMVTLQIVLVVRRKIVGRVELLIGQLALREVLVEEFR